MTSKRKQQHIDHCVKLGPGYPVATGHGNIEWHTFGGVWRDKFNVGTKYTDINMTALYQLCAGLTLNAPRLCIPRLSNSAKIMRHTSQNHK